MYSEPLFKEYREESFYNARAAGDVPYTKEPEDGVIVGWLKGGDYVEVDRYGGTLDCYLHLKGLGWVPFGHVFFIDESAKKVFHPKARKGIE